ncbi:MAG TPA: T9SS type A sorting domain-containing protein, partial [Ignavibacteria bacterium]
IPGPKMIWEFGELGYDYSRCYQSTNGEGGDCNKKLDPKPIRWDYSQNIQRKRLHDVYAELIKLRFHSLYKDVFTTNQINYSLGSGFKWLQITTDTSKICVIGNFDVTPQSENVTFQNAGTWYDYIDGSIFNSTGASQNITLQPGEYHVYLNRNVVSTIATLVISINAPGNNLFIKINPNPVIKNANIDVTVAESGNVKIDLLNSTGQKIEDIYSGFLSRGLHTLNFENNKKFSAGIYLLRVNTKTSVRTIKFILK